MLRVFALALLLPLAACTSDTRSSAAFVNACMESTNWNRVMCECAEERARAELTDKTYTFLVASMGDDDAATARLRDALSFEEATQGGLFMIGAATDCAVGASP